jgi:lipopolysaccharide transport system ATP-binding protein
MSPAIVVEQLRKTYRVSDRARPRHRLLRDAIADGSRRLFRARAREQAATDPLFHHALDGISFSAEHGEVLGIIGANGAGKSTLLKILSRVTEPTAGRCLVAGRVGALLEVGTGFNPELTGRENIFVNGALLGMTREDIRGKFADIVEFSGVDRYIDTPVKRYSSGMQMRLAFAVAAHLEPEIMIVDEVLAVGDAAFQRRCLGRMNDVAHHGRTVLFVSHNMEAMAGLCSRVIWLDKGRIRQDGSAAKVVQAYLSETLGNGRAGVGWPAPEARRGNGAFRFTGACLVDDKGAPIDPALVGQNVRFELSFVANPAGRRNVSIWIWLRTADGRILTGFASRMTGSDFADLPAQGKLYCHVPRFPVGPGTYTMSVAATIAAETADEVDQALVFDVAPGDYFGSGSSLSQNVAFLCDHQWELEVPSLEPMRVLGGAV